MNPLVFYDANPSMFKNRPIGFILAVALIPAFGLGILILLYWFVKTRTVRLKIVGDEVELERGLLSKSRIDLDLRKIRSVHVDQSLLQRVFGVGTIQIFTTGDEAEFTLHGMPEPNKVREYVKKQSRVSAGAVA
ncbi:PH domain-containing protein [Sulfitobacter sp. 20_GPM-1509m]|uniref:PH domain-containing protein n=1 Tax=Sulfitobacter sp. 20_GPM-1509m TaxID=1380367 RepID=UPI00048AD362|nr:PH domain-containing protein [Sulfitobacter sp. 20_GPM-1509m]